MRRRHGRQISRKDFRDAMARVCAPVTVVTTDGLAGRGGFTPTAMCGVSDEPPTRLVCMNGRSTQCDLFLANRRFRVNVLSDAHLHLAGTFAGAIRDMEERHAAAQWQTLASGTPGAQRRHRQFRL